VSSPYEITGLPLGGIFKPSDEPSELQKPNGCSVLEELMETMTKHAYWQRTKAF
jgi:hypothetical protein